MPINDNDLSMALGISCSFTVGKTISSIGLKLALICVEADALENGTYIERKHINYTYSTK